MRLTFLCKEHDQVLAVCAPGHRLNLTLLAKVGWKHRKCNILLSMDEETAEWDESEADTTGAPAVIAQEDTRNDSTEPLPDLSS